MAAIAALVPKIQKDQSKVGSAIEAYDTRHLWALGDQVGKYESLAGSEEQAISEILTHFESGLVRFQPALLKKARAARRAFQSEEEYLAYAKGVSYGKLREVLPILDSDFAQALGVPQDEFTRLRGLLPKLTYEETLAEVRKIREKYDPEGITVDYDQVWEDMEASVTVLSAAVNNRDRTGMSEFRQLFGADFITNSRRLMAALNDETGFKGITAGLSRNFGRDLDTTSPGLKGEINRVVHSLSLLRRADPKARERFRDRVGKMMIGELGTLMKAASSDEETERYLRSRKIIERLKVP
ncbi:MAG: hypothetical protein HY247_08385 [archaeon]|nr:MAG: hypothetical protein HY247_08385 [archaeon]